MRIKAINTQIGIDNKSVVEQIQKNECKLNLSIYAYVAEDCDRHISFNIDEEDLNGFDIWMDIDIYQAELLGKRILQLVENRKQYLESKLNEE
jgi:hypothetical protein